MANGPALNAGNPGRTPGIAGSNPAPSANF